MHGDQVLVELGRKKEDGRAEGRILRVLSRGNPTVVGTFHYGSRHNYVTPIDEKVTQDVIIPRGMEWPSGDKQQPRGPDDRAKAARRKRQRGARSRPRTKSPPPRVGRPGRRGRRRRDHRLAFADRESARARRRDPRLRRRLRRGRRDHHPQVPPAAPLSRRGAAGGAAVRAGDPIERAAPSPRLSRAAHRHHRRRNRARLR